MLKQVTGAAQIQGVENKEHESQEVWTISGIDYDTGDTDEFKQVK